MKHASLEKGRVGKLWEYDCLMICTLLGLSLSNKEMGELCKKYDLLSEEDSDDPSLSFYALHHACHTEEGPVPRHLSRNFSLKYRPFRKALEGMEEEDELDLLGILDKPHPKSLGGALWATLNDSRKAIQAQGIYGAHKVVLNALREYQEKAGALQEKEERCNKGNAEALSEDREKELRLLRQRCEDLEKNLDLQEERYRNLERTSGEEKEQLIGTYEAKITKLRRQVRLLEYAPSTKGKSQKPSVKTPEPAPASKVSPPLPEKKQVAIPEPVHTPVFTCPDRQACLEKNPEGCPFCPLTDATISVIGGLSRLEQQYREVVERSGAKCRYHCGNCQRGGKNLKQMIQSSDSVVFITSINSHNALHVAKGICKKEGKPLHLLRETSPNALEKMITQEVPLSLTEEEPLLS